VLLEFFKFLKNEILEVLAKGVVLLPTAMILCILLNGVHSNKRFAASTTSRMLWDPQHPECYGAQSLQSVLGPTEC